MRALSMPRKLHHLALLQPQHILKLPPQTQQHLLALLCSPPLPPGHIPIPAAWHALPHRLGPQPDSIEAFADIDNDTHDFAVVVIFERLADGAEHDIKPEFVDGGGALVFELVGPFAAVLVLGVFPFGADAFLEKVVVGFEGEFGGGGDVVLDC